MPNHVTMIIQYHTSFIAVSNEQLLITITWVTGFDRGGPKDLLFLKWGSPSAPKDLGPLE